ncbi:hypothetical protein [Paenibacillus elgii]|uniref:hypothetical protein n=1 Tax=Paenibacillus elgii TaxID=189691 RepID=UPI000FDC4DDA|nr:hypothetical protein [Paenibacillus elgii]NEN82621.1 hypothetical protein [Paenibacillus elgii]
MMLDKQFIAIAIVPLQEMPIPDPNVPSLWPFGIFGTIPAFRVDPEAPSIPGLFSKIILVKRNTYELEEMKGLYLFQIVHARNLRDVALFSEWG